MIATHDSLTAEPPGAIDPDAAIVDPLGHNVQQLVCATLERARAGEPRATSGSAPGAPAQAQLTLREHEVLQRIAAGDSNKMIARALALSPHTVKRHVANILGKLGARTRGQAVAWLLRRH